MTPQKKAQLQDIEAEKKWHEQKFYIGKLAMEIVRILIIAKTLIVNLTTAGSKMSEAIEAMEKQCLYVRNRNRIFSKLKALIPTSLKGLFKIIIESQAILDKNYTHYQYGGNRWTIRAFLRKK